MTMRESCIPPTVNFERPDPEADGTLIVAGEAKRHDVRVALSNSFGFGGQNTALVFRRWDA
jgi:3-oxoacyl-[acyl-carrier-protein] synthase II